MFAERGSAVAGCDVLAHPNKQIEESWSQTDITRVAHSDPGGEHSTSMGQNDGNAVWHVLANNKLQRVSHNREQLMIWDLSIEPNKECRISVKYLLKKGVAFTTGKLPELISTQRSLTLRW
jgi:hypothetical protein